MSSYLAAHGVDWWKVARVERIERQEGMVEFQDVIVYGEDGTVLKQWIENVR